MSIAIHWFRQDLRLSDNPALCAAAKHGEVLPIYIWDENSAGADAMGAASRVWLHHSLAALDAALDGGLLVFRGEARGVLAALLERLDVEAVYWNRCYEPWRRERDAAVKAWLGGVGVQAQSFNGSLLWEPWEVRKKDGTPYKVFTPFFTKGCMAAAPPRRPIEAPEMRLARAEHEGLAALELLPKRDWGARMMAHWDVGERAAQRRLAAFVEGGLADYAAGRDFPARDATSRMSPHLHFGEISPNAVWWQVQGRDENAATFRKELGWREFSYALLDAFPELRRENWNEKFDRFEWNAAGAALAAWKRGRTGIPIVDAGMRELWLTGGMHNRVRMIVASFLTKNLGVHWREGEAWFWDCLVDADHASNGASWQWVAGTGADAAPYFRIFNPVTQSQKFDAAGDYIRKFVPELRGLSGRYIHAPWAAPAGALAEAGIVLGQQYPEPIADLKASREAALAKFKRL